MAWISVNQYLTDAQMENNVTELWYFFRRRGCTKTAIAALAGNMQAESTVNPGIWESLVEASTSGYGLVQWTPFTKYRDWVYDYYPSLDPLAWRDNGPLECARVWWEAQNNEQWFRNPEAPGGDFPIDPPVTFAQFLTDNTRSVGVLAGYFLFYYEHPDTPRSKLATRQQYARRWKTFIDTLPDPQPSTGQMPVWMMTRRRRVKRWQR